MERERDVGRDGDGRRGLGRIVGLRRMNSGDEQKERNVGKEKNKEKKGSGGRRTASRRKRIGRGTRVAVERDGGGRGLLRVALGAGRTERVRKKGRGGRWGCRRRRSSRRNKKLL